MTNNRNVFANIQAFSSKPKDDDDSSSSPKGNNFKHANIHKEEPVIDNVISSSTASYLKSLPPDLQLYAQLARLDKPIGTMLLLLSLIHI